MRLAPRPPRPRAPSILTACTVLVLGCLASPAPALESSLRLQTGLGYDTNPFLTPPSYFDPTRFRPGANPGDPPLNSGFVRTDEDPSLFIPVSVRGALGTRPGPARYVLDFRFKGEKFLSEDAKNADNFQTGLELEGRYRLGRVGKRWTRLRVGPSVAYNREIFVDPDTGERDDFAGVDLADRFNYWRGRFQTELEAPLTARTTLDARAGATRYDYEEITGVSSLDNTYYTVGAGYEVELLDSLTVRVGYTFAARNYDERPARDREGDLVAGEERRYLYHEGRAHAEHRLSARLRLTAGYARRWRRDRFVGYDDEVRNEYRLATTYVDKAERRLRVGVTYWDRKAPRAFIFDVAPTEVTAAMAAAGFSARHKAYRAWEAEVAGEFPVTGALKAWLAYELEDENVRDPRFEYERHQVSGGLKAEF